MEDIDKDDGDHHNNAVYENIQNDSDRKKLKEVFKKRL